MSKVHTLSEDVISKIAAGEVIERPASVIKELVENALDAGTQSIALHLKEAGKTSILLKDTGSGIQPDDIENIFRRHSTSKIKRSDDLFNIRSLGFRGEALYSIAAIADITLRSREIGDSALFNDKQKNRALSPISQPTTGWEIHMRGGKKLNLHPVNMPAAGTEIEVKELFFNTPARRKFLKTNVTEMNRILNIFIPYAILYPKCRFLLTHQGKTILDLVPSEDVCERAADTLNLDKKHILNTETPVSGLPFRIRMLLGDINIVRSRRDMQFIFINGRPVQSKSISFHINNIYRLIFPPGQYPFFALYIELPANEIDVNIHPTKREVKLKNEQAVTSALRRLCEKTLMNAGQPKDTQADKPPQNPLLKRILPDTAYDTSPREILSSDESRESLREPTQQYAFPMESHDPSTGEMLFNKGKESLQDKLSRARFLGAFIDKFLIFEVDKSMLVVDQHAAQERITFEHLIEQMDKERVEVQHLLSPYLIKLSPQDLLMWDEVKKTLDAVGFSCTQFDEETIAVHTYPVLLKDPAKAVGDILAGEDVALADHATLARRACRASIMAGDTLNEKQVTYMREQLIKCRDPFTCPHGRPTVIEMTEKFLDKQFLRT